MAASVNEKVAYEVSKGVVDTSTPFIKDFLTNNANDYLKIGAPVEKQLKAPFEEKTLKPEASILRKHLRILALKNEIDTNSKMGSFARRSYKNKLITEAEKLRKRDYEDKIFKELSGLYAAQADIAEKALAPLIETYKQKAEKAADTQFKAGKLSIHKNNTTSRHHLKDDLTSKTQQTLEEGLNKTDVTSEQTVKKAQTEAVTDVLEGTVHSRLRHVGTALGKVVPQDGDKAKIEFTLKAPVGDPTGGGYIGMRIMGQIEHELEYDEEKVGKTLPGTKVERMKKKSNVKNDTYKVKAELALVGGYRVPFLMDVGGEVGGYLEIESNQSMERAMELLSFGFYRRFRESQAIPQDITDGMWGMGGDSAQKGSTWTEKFKNKRKARHKEAKAWGDAFQETMTDKEFVETGGFGAGTGSGSITDSVSIKGSLKGYRGKRYQKNMMSALAKGKAGPGGDLTGATSWDKLIGSKRERNMGRNMNGAELSAEVNVGPFAAGLKGKISWMDNQVKSLVPGKRLLIEQYEKDLKQIREDKAALKTDQERFEEEIELYSADPNKKAELAHAQQELLRVQGELIQKDKAKTDLYNKEEALLHHQLKRQFYSLELELSGATKGGNFANSQMIGAEVAKYAAEFGAKLRETITSFSDSYAKNKKLNNAGADLFGSSMKAVEAGVNHAKNFDPKIAADKLESSKKLIDTQQNLGVSGGLHNQKAWDKAGEFAVKSSSGMKLTFKLNGKRDFASEKPGVKQSKNYPVKAELILDQVSGGSLGTQVATVSLEKATRILRIGVKYKDGNISFMTF
ncbi:MAG: hypothetical protein J0I20_12715 [Chloroflexi bacterium]|nr:hypothetical protein [Chloroflexota bacterium]OJV92570.1 MAG: hypothetical protein BGO39_32220 [Chloroflexi bacterium 54-19]